MIFRPLEFALAFALVATLSIKVLAASAGASSDYVDPSVALKRTLLEAGFHIDPPLPHTDPPLTPARHDACRLLVAQASPLGWHRSLFARYAGSEQALSFVFRDEMTAEQDVWRTSLAFFRLRLMRYAGMRAEEEPVWAILVASGCDLSVLPWKPPARHGTGSPAPFNRRTDQA